MSVLSGKEEGQLKFVINDEVLHTPEVSFLKKKGIVPSPIYNVYWKFAVKRQHIYHLRRKGAIYPWTDDDILLKYKFTNAYRASDRVSQYLIRNVIYSSDSDNFSPEDVFFRIILFKVFNKIETWEAIQNVIGIIDYKTYSFEQYDSILTQLVNNGEKIYSAAYIMPSGKTFGFRKKHRNNLMLIEMMMSDHILSQIARARSLQNIYEILLCYPSLGEFLAFQYTIDINYSELCDFSEMDYVVSGPGAKSGIAKLFCDKNGYSDEYIIQLMAENQEREFERLGLNFEYLGNRKLQLIDCQNLFCETDKYTRALYPYFKSKSERTRIKQLYKPKLLNPIDYFYPPKWKIDV